MFFRLAHLSTMSHVHITHLISFKGTKPLLSLPYPHFIKALRTYIFTGFQRLEASDQGHDVIAQYLEYKLSLNQDEDPKCMDYCYEYIPENSFLSELLSSASCRRSAVRLCK